MAWRQQSALVRAGQAEGRHPQPLPGPFPEVCRSLPLVTILLIALARWLSPAALDLAELLLAYDPVQRATAAQALEAPYFNQEKPPAEPPVGLVLIVLYPSNYFADSK